MRNSDFFKKTKVKVALSIILFFVFTAIISVLLTQPFQRIYANNNGYTMAFVGASETKWGVDPRIIDSYTSGKSYLLATASATIEAKDEMLKSALDNETLDTAVIEVSFFSLCRKMSTLEMDKKVLYYSRISGLENQMDVASRKFSFWDDEYDQLYAEEIFEGMKAWKEIAKGNYGYYKDLRGYNEETFAFDHSLTAEEAKDALNSEEWDRKLRDENVEELLGMIELCKSKGVRPVIITLPLPMSYIWRTDGWDDFHTLMTKLSSEYGFDYYDFNLLENIGDYFYDDASWFDDEHMNITGSEVFSHILGEELEALLTGGKKVYHYYDSYEEAKEHSVYAE